jgi:hypothetical protein
MKYYKLLKEKYYKLSRKRSRARARVRAWCHCAWKGDDSRRYVLIAKGRIAVRSLYQKHETCSCTSARFDQRHDIHEKENPVN